MLTPISLLLSSFSKACKDDGKCTWAGDSQIPPPGEPPGVAPAKSKDITTKGARSYEEEMGIGGRDRETEREIAIVRAALQITLYLLCGSWLCQCCGSVAPCAVCSGAAPTRSSREGERTLY